MGDRLLGTDDPRTLATRANLAFARYRHGRRSEAVADLCSLLADLRSLLAVLRSLPHPDTALVERTMQLLHAWTQQDGR